MLHKLSQLLPRQLTTEVADEYVNAMMAYDLKVVALACRGLVDTEEKFPPLAKLKIALRDSNLSLRPSLPDPADMPMTPTEKQRAYWARIFWVGHWRAFREQNKNNWGAKRPDYVQPSKYEFDQFVKDRWNSPEYMAYLRDQSGDRDAITGIVGAVMEER